MTSPRLTVLPTSDMVRTHAQAINRVAQKTGALSYDGATLGLSSDVDLATGKVYKIAGVQVVGPRQTGWAADTGTAEKTAHTTYAKGTTLTFTDPPTASEMSALATRLAAVELALQGVTRGQKAIKDAAILHGLIGT